jgi:predicted alpha/beta-hydrolase family hydrolase
VHEVANARALLVLGHGAGGGVNAPDLQTATKGALSHDIEVVLVEQPYRVLGRRSPPPAPHLDTAWIAVVEQLRGDVPLIVGGRSSGARVACRTASDVGAVAVLCLAFPLIAPSGASRLNELDAVTVPTLVVQGTRDRFGMPPATKLRAVAEVSADHALKSDREGVTNAIDAWLATVIG